ncbi:MAG: DUF1587 domain-containing protein [Gemmataceae bacterium]
MPAKTQDPDKPRCYPFVMGNRRARSRIGLYLAALLLLAASQWRQDTSTAGEETRPTPTSDIPKAADRGPELEKAFIKSIRPFLEAYCVSCHGGPKPKGDLDLTVYPTVNSVAKDHLRWELVLDRLKAGDMPPKSAKRRPSAADRQGVVAWIDAVREHEAERNAGDPGPVPARRLSNAEYNYTIRDLTGFDIKPTRDFPVDPANQAGFDNSGESLATSPALVKKYLEAARRVADHLVLTPGGIEFAPHPVIADTDRDKFCVNRIIAFYRGQRTDYADYFHAAWQYRERAALGRGEATLSNLATEAGLSAKYLATVWDVLTTKSDDVGPIAALQALWQGLPDGRPEQRAAARAGCEKMRDFVADLRAKLVPVVNNLTSPKVHSGSQPLVYWKDRTMAANRMKYAGGGLAIKGISLPAGSSAAKAMAIPTDTAAAKRYEATFERFCRTFPDAFFISERARVYLDPKGEKDLVGRYLSAGLHNQMGYFRDDGPLYELMLDERARQELDRLWLELDFVAHAPARTYSGFIWFDRTDSTFMRDPQFDPFRAEDKDCTSDAKVKKLAEVYSAKAEAAGKQGGARRHPRLLRRHADHLPPARQAARRSGAASPRGAVPFRRAGLSPAALGVGARQADGLLRLAARA